MWAKNLGLRSKNFRASVVKRHLIRGSLKSTSPGVCVGKLGDLWTCFFFFFSRTFFKQICHALISLFEKKCVFILTKVMQPASARILPALCVSYVFLIFLLVLSWAGAFGCCVCGVSYPSGFGAGWFVV